MSVFESYARYYDLIYRDKDYEGEAAYVASLIGQALPGAKSILELGCGTAKHAQLLSEKGYSVVGVDRSAEMLAKGAKRIEQAKGVDVRLMEGDVRHVRVGREFDVVLSLFHVVSYQTTNADLQAQFATAAMHLKPGGVFVFDVWYGPAVLSERPANRVKRLEDEKIQVTRIAEPRMDAKLNHVEVNYTVFIKDKATNGVEELKESHLMRYLFHPEIDLLLSQAGMSLVADEEWMTRKPSGADTWGVCFVAKKTGGNPPGR